MNPRPLDPQSSALPNCAIARCPLGAVRVYRQLSDWFTSGARRRRCNSKAGELGPVAAFKDVLILQRLPKTRSGKVLRKTMRQIVDGDSYTVPPTIEDPIVLEDLKKVLANYEFKA